MRLTAQRLHGCHLRTARFDKAQFSGAAWFDKAEFDDDTGSGLRYHRDDLGCRDEQRAIRIVVSIARRS